MSERKLDKCAKGLGSNLGQTYRFGSFSTMVMVEAMDVNDVDWGEG